MITIFAFITEQYIILFNHLQIRHIVECLQDKFFAVITSIIQAEVPSPVSRVYLSAAVIDSESTPCDQSSSENSAAL